MTLGAPKPEYVVSEPPTRRVSWDESGITIKAIPRTWERNPHFEGWPWTLAPIRLPNRVYRDMERGYSDSFTVHAAVALEWSVDLLVEFRPSRLGEPRVEIWRLSPSRVRSFSEVRTDAGEHVGVTSCKPPSINVPSKGSDAWPRVLFEFSNRKPTGTTVYSVAVNSKDGSVERVTEKHEALVYELFISYKSGDSLKLAEDIAKALECDFSIWFDKQALQTSDYREKLDYGIHHSDCFLILWSEKTWDEAGAMDTNDEQVINQAWEVTRIVKHVRNNNEKQIFTYHISGQAPDEEYVDQHRHILAPPGISDMDLVEIVRDHIKELRRKKAEALWATLRGQAR